MEIIKALKQGMKYKDVYEERPDIFQRRKKSGLETYSIKNFHDKFYRLVGSKPSRTIVSHLAKDGNSFIHPRQNRSLTPREAARIQTFPDDYIFFGSRSSQFVQIGNAVPPKLAQVIAEVISKYI
jgi:DNA (cytosine-5)-methyltransferase 1